jgi:hypothetical protein
MTLVAACGRAEPSSASGVEHVVEAGAVALGPRDGLVGELKVGRDGVAVLGSPLVALALLLVDAGGIL